MSKDLICRRQAVASAVVFAGVLLLGSSLWLDAATVRGQSDVLTDGADEVVGVTASSTYTNCRFGVAPVTNSIQDYETAGLNISWYLNWSSAVNPVRPAGIEYVQMIRVSDNGYTPSGTMLRDRVLANPGALWLIGNEPDRKYYQDDVYAATYAQIYHDAYSFLKSIDQTARVAAGGIVQPTPVRLLYLDQVLKAYQGRYGEPLPTDAWHIHSFILQEADCGYYPDSCWGAEVPRGVDVPNGEMYTMDDFDNIEVFEARIWSFRSWMLDHGYRNVPLLVTEYGFLPDYYDPDDLLYDSDGNPYDEARARKFMTDTFDFMLTAVDPDLGYPADDNHLVQQWMWYSLDDLNYGGALFDPTTYDIMQLGLDWQAYTSAIAPAVDLVAVEVGQESVPLSTGGNVTLTLTARVANAGNIMSTDAITVEFVDENDTVIDQSQAISDDIGGCGRYVDVSVTWADVTPGSHLVTFRVDTTGQVSESNEVNNEVEARILVATHRVMLPLVSRNW